jgi:hypothetical protein
MNAATGQKIGIGGVNSVGGISGLNAASSAIQGSAISGVGMGTLDNKGLLNFNIQGTNGRLKCVILYFIMIKRLILKFKINQL